MSQYQIVTENDALLACCQTLASSEWLAVDTEFHRDDSYYPELALVQITQPDGTTWLIDPLSTEIAPLLDVLNNKDITKVFHSASQDLELFFNLGKQVPAPVFDTQVAASLLGYGEQIGYGNLVNKMLGVELPKGHTRANWLKRPLSKGELEYAANDVIYLAQIYPQLVEALDAAGRADWVTPEFKQLLNPQRYDQPLDKAWLRVKGSKRLRPRQAAATQALAAWREQTARERNKPRGWILKDDVLLEIARRRPASIEALRETRGLPEGTVKRQGEKLIELATSAPDTPTGEMPEHKRPTPLTNQQDALIDLLMAVVRLEADRQDITPTTLASRKQLEALVRDRSGPLLRGWRQAAIGQRLLAVIDGEAAITVENGELTVA